MSGEHGVSWYTRATATVEWYFPENKVECKYCRYMRADANGARYKCVLTDEILARLDRTGATCPIEELIEQKEEDKNGNGQGEDDPLRLLEDCPF